MSAALRKPAVIEPAELKSLRAAMDRTFAEMEFAEDQLRNAIIIMTRARHEIAVFAGWTQAAEMSPQPNEPAP